jgi:hypothetical protein
MGRHGRYSKMGYRDYSVAKAHIVDSTGQGDFTTISAALTAAVSGQTIFVRPGTYTENPPLKAGVDIVAFVTDALTPNVIINGECTYSSAGTVTISGIQLQTNSNFALSISGSAASVVYLRNCYINALNNTAISFTSSSSSAVLDINFTDGNVATTGITLFSHSSAGTLFIRYGSFFNKGLSTTASNIASGSCFISFVGCNVSISTSSTGSVTIFDSSMGGGSALNATALSLTGTGFSSTFNTKYDGGSASAISVGSGTTLACTGTVTIASSNTNAITGAGTIEYGLLVYSGTSSTNNVTTQIAFPTQPAPGWQWIQTLTASSSANLTFINLPSYTTYVFVLNNLLPATNASTLEMLVSSNNGSTFASSGYTAGINYSAYNSATVNNASATTFAPITAAASNAATFTISGTVFFYVGEGNYAGTVQFGSTVVAVAAFGTCGGTTGVVANAFRFLMSTGNLTSGTISIYGIAV